MPAIARVCLKYGVPLLVDNAHGAHFRFLSEVHPLEAGAAMCADSAHKTLPTLTGTAFLHIGDPKYLPKVKAKMQLFASTSPSYLMMASADYAADYLEKNGEAAFGELERIVQDIKKKCCAKGFSFLNGACDPIRLTISAAPLGYTGEELFDYFVENGISPEMAAGDFVVLIPSPFNEPGELEQLERLLLQLPAKEAGLESELVLPSCFPAIKMSPRKAWFSTNRELSVENTIGKIAAENKAPCPPGIPLIVAGEEIGAQEAEFLKAYGIFTLKVVE